MIYMIFSWLCAVSAQVAVVTGGARGIGAAVATAFVAEGARVVVADVLESREGEPGAGSLVHLRRRVRGLR